MAITPKQMEKLSVKKYSESWIYADVPPEGRAEQTNAHSGL